MNNECLKVENLSISFGGIKAIDKLNFTINEGEIYGLIGPNGAGKTTLFNCITQFYKLDEGEIVFTNNKNKKINLTNLKTYEIIKHGLVRTFQNLELIKELTVTDNVLIGAHTFYKVGILQNALRTKRSKHEEKKLKEKAENILKFLKLYDKKDTLVAELSYGLLKKVELGRTLMSNPKLIILDEPVAGLNDVEKVALSKLLKKIRDSYNCTILLIEHDMRLVMGICDKICVMSFGKKICEGTPYEVKKNEEVQEAYLGKADENEQYIKG